VSESIVLRNATRADARGIADLHAENWRRSYRGNFRDAYLDGDMHAERLTAWSARLEQRKPNQLVCVAVLDDETSRADRIVGFVCAFGAHDSTWGSFIDNLHVDAALQGNGIGTALLRQAAAWLAQRFPGEAVYLLVWEKNPARSLYERLGGRDAGVVEVENPGGGAGRYHRYVWERPHTLTGAWTNKPR
jgi:ribosomal protein S18 acetylase RimI-like enzyme